MKLVMICAGIVSLALASGAAAQPDEANSQPARFERTDTADQMRQGRAMNPNDRVCRAITATGSRLGARRQCRTRQEWADLSRDHREGTESLIRQNLTNTCTPGAC